MNVIPLPVTIHKISHEQFQQTQFQRAMSHSCSTPVNDDSAATNPETKSTTDEEIIFVNSLNCTLNMPTQITILYVILLNVFRMDKSKALDIATIASTKQYFVIYTICAIINQSIIVVMEHNVTPNDVNCIILILLQCLQFILLIIVFLNCNYRLLYFKKKSFPLYWKLYNVTVLYISIYFLRYEFGLNQFDSKYFNLTQSILYSIFVILYVNIAIVVISLYQGFSRISQICIAIGAALFVGFILLRTITHYFGDSLDFEINFFGNNSSVRSIIISSGFDLVVWIIYQIYHIVKYPTTIFLISKIEINWIKA